MSTRKMFLPGLFVAVGLAASNVQFTDVGQFGPLPTAAEARADDEGFDDGGYDEGYQGDWGDADDFQPDEGFDDGGYDEAYQGDWSDADEFDDSIPDEASEDDPSTIIDDWDDGEPYEHGHSELGMSEEEEEDTEGLDTPYEEPWGMSEEEEEDTQGADEDDGEPYGDDEDDRQGFRPSRSHKSVHKDEGAVETDDDAKMRRDIVTFAASHVGEKVGDDGECTTLVDAALAAAGAKPGTNYEWGRKLAPDEKIEPGDIIQFTNCVFKGPDGSTWNLGVPNHTAIVEKANGTGVTLLHQNMDGPPTREKSKVKRATINLNWKTAGSYIVYRPIRQ